MKKNSVVNLQFIVSKMNQKPKNYRLYNYFMGLENSLTIVELKEIRKIAKRETDKFIRDLDKSIGRVKQPND